MRIGRRRAFAWWDHETIGRNLDALLRHLRRKASVDVRLGLLELGYRPEVVHRWVDEARVKKIFASSFYGRFGR